MIEQSIESLCELVRGSSPRPSGDPRYYGGNVPRLMVRDVSRDGMYVTPKIDFLTEDGALKSRAMKKGDLVIAVSGDPGEPSILNVDACIHDGFVGLRNLKNELVFTPYLYRYFKFNKEQSKSQAVGAIYKNLNTAQIKALKIPLPPLDQQKKIAAILDAADAYRQKTKALIEKYDELTQSLFLDMFGDPFTNKKKFPVFKLGELCNELFLGLTSKVEYVEKGGFPLVRAKDINKGVLSFEKVKYISEKQHRKITARRITKRGDVLISKSGTLGTCAIVDSDREFTTYESIFTVRPKEGLLSNIFLVYLVRNEGFKLKLLGNKVGGTVAHLNLKMFRDFEFPLPNIQKQKKFTKRAQAIEAQKAQAQASLAQAEDLFNSLLQRAFKGELTS